MDERGLKRLTDLVALSLPGSKMDEEDKMLLKYIMDQVSVLEPRDGAGFATTMSEEIVSNGVIARNGERSKGQCARPLGKKVSKPVRRQKAQCYVCNKTFANAGNVTKHVNSVHKKLRPYACGLCGMAFGFPDGLERHVEYVHGVAKDFRCVQCDLSFGKMSHLVRHVRRIH